MVRKGEVGTCKSCGNEFVSTGVFKNFCSLECKKESQIALARRNSLKYQRKKLGLSSEDILKTSNCPVCEKDFSFNFSTQPNKKYCSKKCRKTSILKRNQTTDNRYIIFERDIFKCIYCGRTTKEYEIVLTLDHLNPRIKGGEDIAENLITSCQNCNSSKGGNILQIESFEFIQKTIDERNKAQNIHPKTPIHFFE